MKTYEVKLVVEYTKRYKAETAFDAIEAMEFDYVNLYLDDDMGMPDVLPKKSTFTWHIKDCKKIRYNKNIYTEELE